jgi:hypothetical protein
LARFFVSKKPACKSLDDIFAGGFTALLFETRSQQRFRMHVVLKVGFLAVWMMPS